MGVLTIMKFGFFLISAITLVLALTWIIVYCPAKMKQAVPVKSSGGDPKVADYFRKFEDNLDKELGQLQKDEPLKMKQSKTSHPTVKFTIPVERYTDNQFTDMIDQLKHKRLDGYEFLIESMNVSIYRKPKGNAGLFEYKLYANLPDAPPDMLVSVFLDSDYRLKWDTYVTDLYYISKNETGPDVVYFNVDFPWPLANRDYIYARENRRIPIGGVNYEVIIMHSVLNHNVPVKKGVVRVDDFHQMLAVEPVSTGGARAFIHYYDDPKGSIPSWLINWAAKTGVPGFVKDIQRACNGYLPFKKQAGKL